MSSNAPAPRKCSSEATCPRWPQHNDLVQRIDLGRKKLHVPSELLQQIARICDSLPEVCKLRLVCTSFSDGLGPFVAATHVFSVYLDHQGMENLQQLAKSRFAPFLKKLQIGTRPTTSVAPDAIADSSMGEGNDLFLTCPGRPFGTRRRHFTSLKASRPIKENTILRERPNERISARCAELLEQFPKLWSIHSLDEITCSNVLVKYDDGHTNFCTQRIRLGQTNYGPTGRGRNASVRAVHRLEFSFACMNSALLFSGLGDLHNSLSAKSHLFLTLRELNLNVPQLGNPRGDGPVPTELDGAGKLLLSCVNLNVLRLHNLSQYQQIRSSDNTVAILLQFLTSNR